MKLFRKVEDIYNNPKYIGYYYTEDRQRMALESSKEEGIEIGEERGRNEEKKSIMGKLINKGYSKKEIAELLDLPLNKIKTLSK